MGCGDDGPGDAEQFCGEVQENSAELVAAPETVDDIDDYLDLYRRIGEVAPLAIEPHWDALILDFETANSVVPDDPVSLQAAIRRAYATERSAIAVRNWLLANCNVDLGADRHGRAGGRAAASSVDRAAERLSPSLRERRWRSRRDGS